MSNNIKCLKWKREKEGFEGWQLYILTFCSNNFVLYYGSWNLSEKDYFYNKRERIKPSCHQNVSRIH